MILLDTNVFIYLANGTIDAKIVQGKEIAYASITKIEALGYIQITAVEQQYLRALLDECEQLDLTEEVIKQAITLRQQTKITLGDAIIAATALTYELPLWTANEADFKMLEDLQIHNPL